MVQPHFQTDIVFNWKHVTLTLIGRFLHLLWLLLILYHSRSLAQLVLTLLLLTLSIRGILLLTSTYLLLTRTYLLLTGTRLMITLSLLLCMCCVLLIRVLHLFLLYSFYSLFVRNGCLISIFGCFHDYWCNWAVWVIGLSLIWNVLRHRFLCYSLRLILHRFLLNYTLICTWYLSLG